MGNTIEKPGTLTTLLYVLFMNIMGNTIEKSDTLTTLLYVLFMNIMGNTIEKSDIFSTKFEINISFSPIFGCLEITRYIRNQVNHNVGIQLK